MADWNPALYLQYGAERTRPAAELLARIPLDEAATIVDLGCGPGNSTALLRHRWPSAHITGVDNSPAMLEEARAALPDCHFVEADIRQYKPAQPLSLIYANASLQWVPDHYTPLPLKTGKQEWNNRERTWTEQADHPAQKSDYQKHSDLTKQVLRRCSEAISSYGCVPDVCKRTGFVWLCILIAGDTKPYN